MPCSQAWRGHRRGAKCLTYRAWQAGLRPSQACLQRCEVERRKWEDGELSDSPEPEDLFDEAEEKRSAAPSKSRRRRRRSSRERPLPYLEDARRGETVTTGWGWGRGFSGLRTFR